MSSPFRNTASGKANSSNAPLNVDEIMGALLAEHTYQTAAIIVFYIFLGLFFGGGFCLMGVILAWDTSLFIFILCEIFGFITLVACAFAVVWPYHRIEARENGLVYTWRWRHPRGHGTRIRFIPWDEIVKMGSSTANQITTYWVTLENGESFGLGTEQMLNVVRERIPTTNRKEREAQAIASESDTDGEA